MVTSSIRFLPSFLIHELVHKSFSLWLVLCFREHVGQVRVGRDVCRLITVLEQCETFSDGPRGPSRETSKNPRRRESLCMLDPIVACRLIERGLRSLHGGADVKSNQSIQ
jgi:hypothetical protein